MKRKIDVVNLHLTEVCNFSCTYCFAKFNNDDELKLPDWKIIIDKIELYYKRYNLNGRINLAGGEPMVVPFLDELITYIYDKGIKVSIITNSYFLTKDRIDKWQDRVSMIGVSIDSIDTKTNLEIGRCTKTGKTIDYNNLVSKLNYIKQQKIELKVNTVVSKINIKEDISKLYNDVSFDRIKLLQVRVNKGSNDLAKVHEITSADFINYCNKVQALTNKKIVFESSDEIENSYTFIDPNGFLISNDNNTHRKVGNLLENDLEPLMTESNLDISKFKLRYQI